MAFIANNLIEQAMKKKSYFQIKSVDKDNIIKNFKFDEIYKKTLGNNFLVFMHMIISASFCCLFWLMPSILKNFDETLTVIVMLLMYAFFIYANASFMSYLEKKILE